MINSSIIKKNKFIKNIYGKLPVINSTVSTDSRNLAAAQIFIGLKGTYFNGANYCEDVLMAGVSIFVYEGGPDIDNRILTLHEKYPDRCIISATNILAFLQDLAASHMEYWKNSGADKICIGITGSNGKTTNKEMLANFLEGIYPNKISFTKGNFNNHIGVPLTILALTAQDKVSILEFGSNHPGEILKLCEIADPDHGMITNIGKAHLEFFIDEAGVFKEKSELLKYISKHRGDFAFIIDSDDHYLKPLLAYKNVLGIGAHSKNCPIVFLEDGVELLLRGEKITLKNLNILGEHNFKNLGATFLLAYTLWPEKKEELLKRALLFRPRGNRSTWVKKKKINIFLDAYNANPTSMKCAIDEFIKFVRKKKAFPAQCAFIIGDMNELGQHGKGYHYSIGKELKKAGAQQVIFIGKYAGAYLEGYGNEGKALGDTSEFEKGLIPLTEKKIVYLFIKGSRSLQLESILDIT